MVRTRSGVNGNTIYWTPRLWKSPFVAKFYNLAQLASIVHVFLLLHSTISTCITPCNFRSCFVDILDNLSRQRWWCTVLHIQSFPAICAHTKYQKNVLGTQNSPWLPNLTDVRGSMTPRSSQNTVIWCPKLPNNFLEYSGNFDNSVHTIMLPGSCF